ncbi:MAG: tyrosine-type recombinase/integrase [Oscillibacter sp.]|nr:tyrosine-type recombinase/integrase [Oscillibacter sp.]
METYTITKEQIQAYAENLHMEEHSESTVRKYANALTSFYEWLAEDKSVAKERLLLWKAEIGAKNAASTVNVMISAVNSFLAFMSWDNLRVKQVKTQRRIYRDKDRELTKSEYMRLLNAARNKGNLRLYYLMQTLGSTGIRVSELPYITLEALRNGSAVVDCKGKQRTVLIPKKLRKLLLSYCETAGIVSGSVFVTRSGKPLNRSNIWREMRTLCAAAHVEAHKVFPHNFRHLFAVSYYRMAKDVAKLADLLGHASIDTTRIYIMESGAEHERQMEKLGLVV